MKLEESHEPVSEKLSELLPVAHMTRMTMTLKMLSRTLFFLLVLLTSFCLKIIQKITTGYVA